MESIRDVSFIIDNLVVFSVHPSLKLPSVRGNYFIRK